LNRISFPDFQLASLIFDSRLQGSGLTSVKKKSSYGESAAFTKTDLFKAKNNKTDTKTGEYEVFAQTRVMGIVKK